MCRNGGQECLTLVLTHLKSHQRTNIGFLTFKICYQAGAQSFKHYSTYLYKITSMNKIEIKNYKFPQEDNVSMFDIGLFYSICVWFVTVTYLKSNTF